MEINRLFTPKKTPNKAGGSDISPFVPPTVPVFKHQLVVALQQTVYLDRVIVREVERQMVLEMKAKEK